MNLYEFKQAVFGRAIRYLISPYDLSLKQAEARAAKEIVAENRAKAAREKKKHAPVISMPAPAPDDASIESELVGAKERLFAKLDAFFARHDANVARERAAKRDAKRAARAARKAAKAGPAPRNNVVPLPRPDASPPEVPVPDTHPTAHLVYAGGITGAVRVEDPRPTPTTVNYWNSIRRNEELQRRRQERST